VMNQWVITHWIIHKPYWWWFNETLYNTLQQTATHCDTLQHTATSWRKYVDTYVQGHSCSFYDSHCDTLQHTVTHCNTLQHSAIHCNTLQHTATHCNTLQHTATHCNTAQHTATHCNTLWTHTFRVMHARCRACRTHVCVHKFEGVMDTNESQNSYAFK